MTKQELIERYGLEWYNYYKERKKERYWNEPDFREREKERCKEYQKEYYKHDLNSNGKTKNYIRKRSNAILFSQRKHTKLKDYQIHHAFGYDDPFKFIYVSKSLHCKIHQYLRDNNIDADSNHYDFIKHMINECEEYTYISV